MDSAFTTNIQYTRARRAATARAAAMREPRRNNAARDAYTVALGCRGRVGRGPHVSETLRPRASQARARARAHAALTALLFTPHSTHTTDKINYRASLMLGPLGVARGGAARAG